jgi:hypothetical protein
MIAFPVTTFHLNLDFAKQIGPPVHEAMADFGRHIIGDWVFSPAAFGAEAPDPGDEFLREFRERSRHSRAAASSAAARYTGSGFTACSASNASTSLMAWSDPFSIARVVMASAVALDSMAGRGSALRA